MPKIVINGRTYDGPETMPPEVRQQYETALRLAGASGQAQTVTNFRFITMVNGKIVSAPSDLSPDARTELEHLQSAPPRSPGLHTSITINGAHFGSRDEMPAEVRAQYDQALTALSASGPAGKVEAAALRQLLRSGADGDQPSSISWRVIGWLIFAALAVIYLWARSKHSF